MAPLAAPLGPAPDTRWDAEFFAQTLNALAFLRAELPEVLAPVDLNTAVLQRCSNPRQVADGSWATTLVFEDDSRAFQSRDTRQWSWLPPARPADPNHGHGWIASQRDQIPPAA